MASRIEALAAEWEADRDVCLAWLADPKMHADATHPQRLAVLADVLNRHAAALRAALAEERAQAKRPERSGRHAAPSNARGRGGKIAAALGIVLLTFIAIFTLQSKEPDVAVPSGQSATVPPQATATPAPTPTTKPTTSAPRSKWKPPPKPAKAPRVDATKLRIGVSSRHVTAYQQALRAYLGAHADAYNPSGATGFYGKETAAMTRAVYRDLAKKQGDSWLQGDTRMPGRGLLKVLGLGA